MKWVVVVTKPELGVVPSGEESFGREMLDRYFHTMEAPELRPATICLYTRGIEAACQGSDCLLGLQLLAGLGVEILVCQTCLDRFGLRDSLALGTISTMKDIVSRMVEADKVLYV